MMRLLIGLLAVAATTLKDVTPTSPLPKGR
jgi:hypothetical protein